MDCVPKNRSEGNQIQRKNENTTIKHESRLIFSAATGRVDEKLFQTADQDQKTSAQWP